MRIDETSTDAPLTSPEEPPATSYTIVFLHSPVCLAVGQGGSQRGLHRVLGRASARFAGRRVLRAGPAVE